MRSSFSFSFISVVAIFLFTLIFLIDYSESIRCYKCKGDDECDFKTRHIYIDNCTWATKCWGARIGGHFIRSCADDRCEIQIGVGSYIESKCCYTDMCNDDSFFFPNESDKLFVSHMFKINFCVFWTLFVYFVKPIFF